MFLVPNGLRSLPWKMLFIVLAIVILGLTTLYSAAGGSLSPWAANQGIRFILLLGFMLMVSRLEIRTWMMWAYPFYGVSLALLLVVELFGKVGMGAQRWIDLGIIRLQPSEFMKIAVVLALARLYQKMPPMFINSPSGLLSAIGIVALPAGLVMLQPDLGTAMMISFTGVTMIFLAGAYMRWFVGAGLAILAMLPVAWNMLHDYQRNRVLVFLNPDSDPLGTGYHISQSKIAIGSGGLFGKGFLQGTQSHLEYLPETHTDFIFATMTEEWGVIGGLFTLLAYGYLVRWGNNIGRDAKPIFLRLTAFGLSFTLFLYVAINIGMVMGLLPVVGIPLPLMSYGGSAMMTVMLMLAILMSIYRHEQAALPQGRFGGRS